MRSNIDSTPRIDGWIEIHCVPLWGDVKIRQYLNYFTAINDYVRVLDRKQVWRANLR